MTANLIRELLNQWDHGITLPGRARRFIAPEFTAVFGPGEGAGEWPALPVTLLLAVACAAAEAEQARGGRVAVVLPRGVLAHADTLEAACAAGAVVGDNLLLLISGGLPADEAVIVACGWNRPGAPRARCIPELPATAVTPSTTPALGKEWPPVHLETLDGTGGVPPWPRAHGTPDARIDAHLRWLAEREPRVLLPHRTPGWSWRPSGASLWWWAARCAEGRRVAWLLPPGADLVALMPTLRQLAAYRLGLKLIVTAPVSLTALAELSQWWVSAAAEEDEAAAILARMMDHEDPALLLLPAAPAQLAIWPTVSQQPAPWVPGAGRWLTRGAQGSMVCLNDSADICLRAADVLRAGGTHVGVYHVSSLIPLPVAELRVLTAPILIVSSGAVNVATLVQELLPPNARARHVAGGVGGTAPDASTCAQAMRELIG